MLEASPAVESGHESTNMQTTTVSSSDISRFNSRESTRSETLTMPLYGMHSQPHILLNDIRNMSL